MSNLSLRQICFDRLAHLTEPDVIILGGGVNGIGVLRDLALNGVSAVLLETSDFCNGASGASSRMAHGGLRYLEGREFKLVAESARERNRLIRQARHLVHPLQIVVPLNYFTKGFWSALARFAGLSKNAGPLSLLTLQGALTIYEYFGRFGQRLPGHKILCNRQAFPKGLSSETKAVVTYYDGQINFPEGLLLEILSESVNLSSQISALNHVNWSLEANGDLRMKDRFSNQTYSLRPKVIINATGAWIDRVNSSLGARTDYIRGVKGAHLVLDHKDLKQRLGNRAFYFDDGHGRMVITLPVGENTLVGTTEIETDEPDDKTISTSEQDYLLTAINSLFKDIHVTNENIVSLTSGIRPLRNSKDTSATQAGRDHTLERDHTPQGVPIVSMTGGKWTTFRSFSEEATQLVYKELSHTPKTSTADHIYPGANPCSLDDLLSKGAPDRSRAEILKQRYGAISLDVAEFCARSEDKPLNGAPDYTESEIRWNILKRGACTLEDILLRRTHLSFRQSLKDETLIHIASILQETIERNRQDLTAEINQLQSDPRMKGARKYEENAA